MINTMVDVMIFVDVVTITHNFNDGTSQGDMDEF